MIKTLVTPKYAALSEFIHSLPDIFTQEGETVHDGRNVIKTFTTADGTCLNVKRYHIPSGLNRLVYSSGIRKPKGLRAYLYPQTVIACGIDTPEPVAYIEERRCGLLGYSYFVSIQCHYEHTLYDIADAAEGTYEQLAAELAAFTAHMHNHGIMHLDYSPGNILYTLSPSTGHYCFSIVDINRMYFGNVSINAGLSNFKRLWGPKRFFTIMISEYARHRDTDVDEALSFALGERRKFWTRYLRKHTIEFSPEL